MSFLTLRGDLKRIVVSKVAPYQFVAVGSIKGQCKSDRFYGEDAAVDAMLKDTEDLIAPALYEVNANQCASREQWDGLRLLATQLHYRTKKAAELAKIAPRFHTHQYIKHAIETGKLPPPAGGWKPEMMDFQDVPKTLLGPNALRGYFETMTLRCKLLRAPAGSFFITSDHPSVRLNQFAADAKGLRDYVGFAQSGFQMVLPLGPTLCAFLFDSNVYKVGGKSESVVTIEPLDVEILNSFQVQSADTCVYAHRLDAEPELRRLVEKYGRFRKSSDSVIKSFPQNEKETLVMFSTVTMAMPKRWRFCTYLKNVKRSVGDLRDPMMSHILERLIEDIEQDRSDVPLETRMDRVIQNIPENEPIYRRSRSDPEGYRLPKSAKQWRTGIF